MRQSAPRNMLRGQDSPLPGGRGPSNRGACDSPRRDRAAARANSGIVADVLRVEDGVVAEHWDVIQDSQNQVRRVAAARRRCFAFFPFCPVFRPDLSCLGRSAMPAARREAETTGLSGGAQAISQKLPSGSAK